MTKTQAERAVDDRRVQPRRRRRNRIEGSAIVVGARAEGLLDGERSEHISIRTTPQLLAAAKRRTGVSSNTELVELALATLATSDPVAAFMKRRRGKLGKAHKLEH